MANTRKRIVLFSVILTIAGLLISAFSFVDVTSAEPKQTKASMSSRVQSQREMCETIGGGEMDYVNSYENGKLVGVTTYCKGGTQDGWNCANTATTYDCWQGPKSRTVQPPTFVQDLPKITAIEGDIETDTDSGSVAQPGDGSVLENRVVDSGPLQPTAGPEISPITILVPLD